MVVVPPLPRLEDPAGGYVEEPSFFGSGSERSFGTLARPLHGDVRAGLLVCPSICADLTANYRREVSLARKLAKAGFAVQRFHYRGTGHSDGEHSEMTFQRMCEDAEAALSHLVTASGVKRPAVLGTRLGALVASFLVASAGARPMVLWEPINEGSKFFREALRVAKIGAIKAGAAESANQGASDLGDLLECGNDINVLGYDIGHRLFRSSSGETLPTLLQAEKPEVLLVQFASPSPVRPDIRTLADALRDQGCEVDVEALRGQETWWFPKEHAVAHQELVERTVAWLQDAAGRSSEP